MGVRRLIYLHLPKAYLFTAYIMLYDSCDIYFSLQPWSSVTPSNIRYIGSLEINNNEHYVISVYKQDTRISITQRSQNTNESCASL